jgi:hydroxymethylglutaryl-CoA reductase
MVDYDLIISDAVSQQALTERLQQAEQVIVEESESFSTASLGPDGADHMIENVIGLYSPDRNCYHSNHKEVPCRWC